LSVAELLRNAGYHLVVWKNWVPCEGPSFSVLDIVSFGERTQTTQFGIKNGFRKLFLNRIKRKT